MADVRVARDPVAIVIVNWNSGDDLPRCLASVLSQVGDRDRVIVVDNGSSDGSMERARERFPDVDYLSLGENRGYCAAAFCAW